MLNEQSCEYICKHFSSVFYEVLIFLAKIRVMKPEIQSCVLQKNTLFWRMASLINNMIPIQCLPELAEVQNMRTMKVVIWFCDWIDFSQNPIFTRISRWQSTANHHHNYYHHQDFQMTQEKDLDTGPPGVPRVGSQWGGVEEGVEVGSQWGANLETGWFKEVSTSFIHHIKFSPFTSSPLSSSIRFLHLQLKASFCQFWQSSE